MFCCNSIYLDTGTRTLDFFNGDTSGNENSFLLAVKEQLIDEGIFKKLYGVCFVDTCVGTFHVCGLAT